MSDLTDPVDPIHRDSDISIRWIRGYVAALREKVAVWEPRPYQPEEET